jgi:hypothetical protein
MVLPTATARGAANGAIAIARPNLDPSPWLFIPLQHQRLCQRRTGGDVAATAIRQCPSVRARMSEPLPLSVRHRSPPAADVALAAHSTRCFIKDSYPMYNPQERPQPTRMCAATTRDQRANPTKRTAGMSARSGQQTRQYPGSRRSCVVRRLRRYCETLTWNAGIGPKTPDIVNAWAGVPVATRLLSVLFAEKSQSPPHV